MPNVETYLNKIFMLMTHSVYVNVVNDVIQPLICLPCVLILFRHLKAFIGCTNFCDGAVYSNNSIVSSIVDNATCLCINYSILTFKCQIKYVSKQIY